MNTRLRPLAALLLLAAACAGPRPEGGRTDEAAPAWPAFAPPAEGETVYRVDPEASLLQVRVDPGGPMARLGHSHVVGGSVLEGLAVAGENGIRFDLGVDVAAMDVDRPEWRLAHGLDGELDDDAIAGTRRNLLGPDVLDAERHPRIAIRSVAVDGPSWLPSVTARIRLQGRVHEVALPVAVQREPGRVRASGLLELDHADLGLTPFSAAGGALTVADPIRIRFRIEAVADRADVAIIAGWSTSAGRAP